MVCVRLSACVCQSAHPIEVDFMVFHPFLSLFLAPIVARFVRRTDREVMVDGLQ